MTILDKLIEKKDVYTYIRARKAVLEKAIKAMLKTTLPKKRELLKQRLVGRIRELERLEGLMRQNKLRETALKDWPVLYEDKKEKVEACIFDTASGALCTKSRRVEYPTLCAACGHNPEHDDEE